MKKDERNDLLFYAEDFRLYLLEQKYAYESANNLVGVFKCLGKWMKRKKIIISKIDYRYLDQFISYRKRKKYICWKSRKGLYPIIKYLEEKKLVLLKILSHDDPLTRLSNRYKDYLSNERGLSKGIIFSYNKQAIQFLLPIFKQNKSLTTINAKNIRKYILKQNNEQSTGAAKNIVAALRSLLRWLYIENLIPCDFRLVVPAISSHRSRGIPKKITKKQISCLLKACDRRTHKGKRNHAILLLFIELGLRKIEIVNLTIDSINWRNSTINVESKGSSGILPFSKRVGEALSSYIKISMHRTDRRNLFLRVRAPCLGITGSGISAIIKSISEKVDLKFITSHYFRHSLATNMLHKGSDLEEIGRILRHSSIDTTSIYAKVDDRNLSNVIMPWAGDN